MNNKIILLFLLFVSCQTAKKTTETTDGLHSGVDMRLFQVDINDKDPFVSFIRSLNKDTMTLAQRKISPIGDTFVHDIFFDSTDIAQFLNDTMLLSQKKAIFFEDTLYNPRYEVHKVLADNALSRYWHSSKRMLNIHKDTIYRIVLTTAANDTISSQHKYVFYYSDNKTYMFNSALIFTGVVLSRDSSTGVHIPAAADTDMVEDNEPKRFTSVLKMTSTNFIISKHIFFVDEIDSTLSNKLSETYKDTLFRRQIEERYLATVKAHL